MDHCKITADFEAPEDYPLVKTKFGVFNSGIVRLSHYQRDKDLLKEVGPESLRIDLGWGAPWIGWPNEPVSGTEEHIEYDFSEMDAIANVLNEHNVLPYWAYCYTPVPLQAPTGDWQSIPSSFVKWGEILGKFADHYRHSSPPNPVGYHEIHNEPDNFGVFFVGQLDDYLQMYFHGATAIKRADPDAMAGGPALAFTPAWIAPFLDYVTEHNLPLDFFSFHFYGSVNWENRDFPAVLNLVRENFANRPQFAMTEFHLNEYNSYDVPFPAGGVQEKYPLASALLRDFKYFLAQPDLTLVHWAQFMDSGQGNFSGMVSIDGHRRATFNAYKIYGMMPVDRYRVTLQGPEGLDAMASSDSHKSSLVVWNRASDDAEIEICMNNIPFSKGNLQVFRIDANHGSYGDNPDCEMLEPVEVREAISTADLVWRGVLPLNGIVYLEVDDGTGKSELMPVSVAQVLRVLHYYPDRTKRAYADFDKNTWIARLGMSTEEIADAVVAVVAEQLPPVLDVKIEVNGTLRRINSESLLGVRVDFMADGEYVKSVLFQGPYDDEASLYDAQGRATIPWGTQSPPDDTIHIPDLAHFQVNVRELAPTNWNGQAILTFIMRNTGPGTSAKIITRRFAKS